MHLQAKEKQVGRLLQKLQRQQSAVEEIEALKVCPDLNPQGVVATMLSSCCVTHLLH